nr:DinB family protein [Olivibacter sp. XZL3]
MEAPLEVWMRGPIAGVPPLLQPVAHALLQAKEELTKLLTDFPDERLWDRPAGVASVAFHIQHITGVIDRMFTYAKQQPLSDAQFRYLQGEGIKNELLNTVTLLEQLTLRISEAVDELKAIPEETLTEERGIGRKKIPTTCMGLLFHAAEHTQRHVGQTLVTAKIILAREVNET